MMSVILLYYLRFSILVIHLCKRVFNPDLAEYLFVVRQLLVFLKLFTPILVYNLRMKSYFSGIGLIRDNRRYRNSRNTTIEYLVFITFCHEKNR